MIDLLAILLAAVFINNFVLVKFLGLCPVMGVSKQIEPAIGLALATAFVLTLAAGLSHLVWTWLLLPLGLEWLRTLAFILVIAALVFGFGAAVGFGLVLVLFAGLRERLEAGDVPGPFRGAPIGLITAGLMALAFMGFTGMGAR